MPIDSDIEIWTELLKHLSQVTAVRILLTLTGGDKYEIKNRDQVAVGRRVLTVFDETGSKLLFQISNIVCVDVFELEED